MAGGMTSGRGRTLADRSALSGIGTGPRPQPEPQPEPQPGPQPGTRHPPTRAQHCWVVDAPQSPGRWPGLLTEWSRDDAGTWHGRVVWAVDGDDPAETVLLQAWLAAHLLRGPRD